MLDWGYCSVIQSNSKMHRNHIVSLIKPSALHTLPCDTEGRSLCACSVWKRALFMAMCDCVCAEEYCVCFWHLVSSDSRLEGSPINSVSSFSSKQTKSLCFNCYSSEADRTFNGAACQALCQGFFLLPLISFHLYMFYLLAFSRVSVRRRKCHKG